MKEVYSESQVNSGYWYSENVILKIWEAFVIRKNLMICALDNTGVKKADSFFSGSNPLSIQSYVSAVLDSEGSTKCFLSGGVTESGISQCSGSNQLREILNTVFGFVKDRNEEKKVARILFPFNVDGNHWNLGEWQIVFNSDWKCIKSNLTLYEPYHRKESTDYEPFQKNMDKVIQLESQMEVINTSQQTDGFSCGVICVDNGFRRILADKCQSVKTESGAILERLAHLNLVGEDCFLRKQSEGDGAREFSDLPFYQRQYILALSTRLVTIEGFSREVLTTHTETTFRRLLMDNQESLKDCKEKDRDSLYDLLFNADSPENWRNDSLLDSAKVVDQLCNIFDFDEDPTHHDEISDHDDSSDDEDMDSVFSKADSVNEKWLEFKKTSSFKNLPKKEVKSHNLKLRVLFAISYWGISLLYSKAVEKIYRLKGKGKSQLGKDKMPTRENISNWVEVSLKSAIADTFFAGHEEALREAYAWPQPNKELTYEEESDHGSSSFEDALNSKALSLSSIDPGNVIKGLKKLVCIAGKERNAHDEFYTIKGKSRSHENYIRDVLQKEDGSTTKKGKKCVKDKSTLSLDTPKGRRKSSERIIKFRFTEVSSSEKLDSVSKLLKSIPENFLVEPKILKEQGAPNFDLGKIFSANLCSQLLKSRFRSQIFRCRGVKVLPIYDLSQGLRQYLVFIRTMNCLQKRLIKQMKTRKNIGGGAYKLREYLTTVTVSFGEGMRVSDGFKVTANSNRNNHTTSGGKYVDLCERIKLLEIETGINGVQIAKWVLKAVYGRLVSDKTFVAMRNLLTVCNGLSLIADLIYLLFICEPMRYPGTIFLSYIAVKLICDQKISWENALYDEGAFKFSDYKGGLIGMTISLKDIGKASLTTVGCARWIQSKFMNMVPIRYQYHGDLHEYDAFFEVFLVRTFELIKIWKGCYPKLTLADTDESFEALKGTLFASLPNNLRHAPVKKEEEKQGGAAPAAGR